MRRGPLAAACVVAIWTQEVRADEPAPPSASPSASTSRSFLRDEVDAFDRIHARATRQQLRVMDALVAEGVVSTAVGIGLLVPSSYDQGLRVAGGVTLGFGVIDLALASIAIPGLVLGQRKFDRERPSRDTPAGLREARRKDASFARKQTLLFAINAGLDGGYLLGGLAAVAASQLGVDHPDRWLGGGIAIASQGVLLLGIDVAAMLIASRQQAALFESLTPMLSVTPTPEGTRTTLGVAGRF